MATTDYNIIFKNILIITIIFTSIITHISVASQYVYSYQITKYDANPLVQFVFLEGGIFSISIDVKPQNHPLFFLLCSDDDWKNIFGYKIREPTCDLLKDVNMLNLCDVGINFTDTLSVYREITKYNKYLVNILDCQDNTFQQQNPVNITLDLKMINPDNNNLSAELIPAPLMYTMMGVIWSIVLLLWIYNNIQHIYRVSKIHYVMSLYPLLKLIICFYNASLIRDLSRLDTTPTQIFFHKVLDIFFNLYIQVLLLLLGTGWYITQNTIKGDRYNILALVGGLSVAMILDELYVSDSISYLFVELFILSIRVFLLFYVFIAININSRQLEYHILQYNPSQESETSLSQEEIVLFIKKFKLFVMFKLILLFWVALITLKFFTSLLLYGGIINNWVSMMNSENIDLILYICIGYNYRAREENIFKIIRIRSPDIDSRVNPQHIHNPQNMFRNNNRNNNNIIISNTSNGNENQEQDGIEMDDLSNS